jgi:hypothetical protein
MLYIPVFILCLPLSWYLCKNFFVASSVQDKFSALVDSGGKFVFYLVVLLIIPAVMFSTNHFASSFFIYIFAGIVLLVIQNLETWQLYAIGIGIVACFIFSSVASIIEPFLLVIVGSILFQFGFTKMREAQFMRDIPRSRIRSVAMGAVEINGLVASENVLATPYSKSPCVYCQSELETYSESEDSDSDKLGGWEKIPGPSFKVPFWVKDETGKIMVDPEGAEFKISDREIGMLDKDGSPYNADDSVSENYSPKPGDRRYVEQFLAPNDTVFILGTAALRKDGETEQLVIRAGTGGAAFVISDSREKYAVHQEKWEMVAGLSYGIVIFMTGFLGVLYLSNLL